MEREITFLVKAPVECTEQEFQEWIKFCLHYTAHLNGSNPLCGEELEAIEIIIR